ncbi:MAG: hypothetical protein HY921_09815 [Elusimicrobia bacterium]|nr:hypothetical protein [Elusimicrobiota bacterium]
MSSGKWIISLCCLAAACRGTIPELHEPPSRNVGGFLVGLKISTELSGEASSGKFILNLESGSEIYRLALEPGQSYLYQVEPGIYRLAPERSLFGGRRTLMSISAQGQEYQLPFPRELDRHESLSVEPGDILVLGRVEVSVAEAQAGREALVRIRLNQSVAARRDLVQAMIRKIMDPSQPLPARESALSWVQALEKNLRRLFGEKEKGPALAP